MSEAADGVDCERLVNLNCVARLQWTSDVEAEQLTVFFHGEDQPFVVVTFEG